MSYRNRVITGSITAAALVVGAGSASAVVLLDDQIDGNITFSIYNNFGPSSAGQSAEVTSPPAPADRILFGDASLRTVAIDDHVFTGSGTITEIQLGNGGERPNLEGESTPEERDLTQADNPDGTTLGEAWIRFSYRVVRLQDHVLDGDANDQPDVGGVQGIPDASITDLPEYPNVTVSLRFFDPASEGGDGNNVVASTGSTISLVNDNAWHTEVFPMTVLTKEQRAAANDTGVWDEDVPTVLGVALPNIGNLGVLSKVTYDIFFDRFELFFEDPTTMAVPGDADGDGDVDAFDLGIWQTQFGQTGDGLSADFDKDGDVDAFDLGLWQTNFGTGVEGVAVPEPAGLMLLLSGGAILSLRRRRVISCR